MALWLSFDFMCRFFHKLTLRTYLPVWTGSPVPFLAVRQQYFRDICSERVQAAVALSFFLFWLTAHKNPRFVKVLAGIKYLPGNAAYKPLGLRAQGILDGLINGRAYIRESL